MFRVKNSFSCFTNMALLFQMYSTFSHHLLGGMQMKVVAFIIMNLAAV